jgi:HSP20 family protein
MGTEMDKSRGMAWNPFKDFEAMRREMDRMLERPFFMSPTLPAANSNLWPGISSHAQKWITTPAADYDETPTHYLMTVDLPGLSKDEVHVEVHENDIRIFGERKEELKDSSNHVTERFVGRFERLFNFSTSVDSAKVEAAYENGVLKIAAPKVAGRATRQIRIGDSAKDSPALKQFFGAKVSKG